MIEGPGVLWELFTLYKGWLKANPIIVEDWVGGMGKKVQRKKERPLTMEGFESFVFEQGFNSELSHYFSNKEGRYADFVAICSRIRTCIRGDQIEGGMAGIFNPSVTQRLNNLTEKVQEDNKTEVTIKVKYERKGDINNAE